MLLKITNKYVDLHHRPNKFHEALTILDTQDLILIVWYLLLDQRSPLKRIFI